MEPAAKDRLKKGSRAKKEKPDGNDGVAEGKQAEARHPTVGDPPEDWGGDCVGQPKHHEDQPSGGGGEAVGVGQERL